MDKEAAEEVVCFVDSVAGQRPAAPRHLRPSEAVAGAQQL